MAVYFITGKLGAGKSLVSVGRIQQRLKAGCPVATNLDIKLTPMLGKHKKNTRLLRVPDKPEIHDLEALGYGNKSYDEDKNGLLVLDECGTWFNSRTWNDKGRQKVINWLLHARKLGWDIIFIVQDLSIVDKQARLTLAEHTVYCRRSDRLTIPFIGAFYKLITGSKLPIPKVHFGIVRYGDTPQSLKVDTWTTVGGELYRCYDTKQMFSDFYDSGVYSVLPPFYTHGRYTVNWDFKNIMRITKIIGRKYSRVSTFAAGAMLSFFINAHYSEPTLITESKEKEKDENKISLVDKFKGYKITSFSDYPGQDREYVISKEDNPSFKSKHLIAAGYNVTGFHSCHLEIEKDGENASLNC